MLALRRRPLHSASSSYRASHTGTSLKLGKGEAVVFLRANVADPTCHVHEPLSVQIRRGIRYQERLTACRPGFMAFEYVRLRAECLDERTEVLQIFTGSLHDSRP